MAIKQNSQAQDTVLHKKHINPHKCSLIRMDKATITKSQEQKDYQPVLPVKHIRIKNAGA